MMATLNIQAPLDENTLKKLKAGDQAYITGVIYVGRDAAHKRMVEALDKEKPLPFDIKGQVIYFMGPSPAKPGQPIGSAGPTTSGRMDSYSPRLIAEGLKGMIGKGARSAEVREALKKHGAVYLGAIGGAGALLSKSITKAEIIAYEDLGPEAVLRLEVKDFPATVINDNYGGDLYTQGREKYRLKD